MANFDPTNIAGWQVQELVNLEQGGAATSILDGALNNVLAQTYDPIFATGAAPVADETLVGVLTEVEAPISTTKMCFVSDSATVTHSFGAIIDLKGNVLGKTGDLVATWSSAANTLIVGTWATAFVLSPGKYYFAVSANGTTPTIWGIISNAFSANANTSAVAGNLRCATLATGLTAGAIPTSPLTLTSAAAVASCPWIGIL